MSINAITITWNFYALFLVLSILGFISNWLPIEKSFLETNAILNFTHLITAAGFSIVTKQGVNLSIQFIRIIGMVYMLISLIGFMGVNILIGEEWADVIYLNLLSYV